MHILRSTCPHNIKNIPMQDKNKKKKQIQTLEKYVLSQFGFYSVCRLQIQQKDMKRLEMYGFFFCACLILRLDKPIKFNKFDILCKLTQQTFCYTAKKKIKNMLCKSYYTAFHVYLSATQQLQRICGTILLRDITIIKSNKKNKCFFR